jgi:hypothetical protein
MLSPSRRCLSPLPHCRCAAVIFTQRSTVWRGGGCLRVPLRGGCLCTALHSSRLCGVTWRSSSRYVAWRRLRVTQGLSSHGCRLHVPSCCAAVVSSCRVVVGALSSVSPLPGRRAKKPFRAPANGRGYAGAGHKGGGGQAPVCARMGGRAQKGGGFPGQKGGCQRVIGGRGKGSHTFRAPANGRGHAGGRVRGGRNTPA